MMQMYGKKIITPNHNIFIFNTLMGSIPHGIPSHITMLNIISLFGFHIYKQYKPCQHERGFFHAVLLIMNVFLKRIWD